MVDRYPVTENIDPEIRILSPDINKAFSFGPCQTEASEHNILEAVSSFPAKL
jgi:hypothetical protein